MLNILIIENDAQCKRLYRIIFEMLGNIVIDVASNGIDGIESFYKHKESIDVITIDYNMPYKNGIEVLDDLKDEIDNVSIVFITANKSIKDLISNYNIDYFLSKPFEMKEIISIFENIEKTQKIIKQLN
jgi:DNA-binding NtrC family response regulator